jgi:branched-chain amino acid transport system substrate-binding protein
VPRTLKIAFACVVLTLGLTQAQTMTTIKFPMMLPISTSLNYFALEGKNVGAMAIRAYATRFAKMGFKLELAIYDDKGIPDVAKKFADTLKQDPSVLTVVGGATSSVALALSETLQDSHIAVISSSASANDITEKGFANFNRLVASNAAQAEGTVKTMAETLSMKTIFIVDDASVTGIDLVDNITAAVNSKQNLKIVERVSTQERTNFADLIDRFQKSKADGIEIAFTSPLAAAAFVKQIRAAKVQGEIFGNVVFSTSQFLEILGKDAEGLFAATYSPPATAYNNAKSFSEEYKLEFGQDPTGLAILAYDTCSVALEGILKSFRANGKIPNRKTVETAIRKINLKGMLTGDIRFNSVGDRRNVATYVLRIGADLRPRLFNTLTIDRP